MYKVYDIDTTDSIDEKCNVVNETVSYSDFIKRIKYLRFAYTSGGNCVSF